MLCDSTKISIKVSIFKAWKRRRSITSEIVCPMPCYKEVAPIMNRDIMEINPVKCIPGNSCSLEPLLKAKPEDLKKLREAIDVNSGRAEDKRRSKALKELYRKPKTPIGENDCRNLGDAIFAFFAPNDSVILTTNTRDHEPLAKSLGKDVATP